MHKDVRPIPAKLLIVDNLPHKSIELHFNKRKSGDESGFFPLNINIAFGYTNSRFFRAYEIILRVHFTS